MAEQARCKKCRIYYTLTGKAQKITLKSKQLKCVVCNEPLSATSWQCRDSRTATIGAMALNPNPIA